MPSFPLTFPVIFGAGTHLPYDVAGDIINDAALELGLAPGTAVDPYSLNDPNMKRLCGLLKSWGRREWRRKRWSQFEVEKTFVTVQDQASYPFPDDFGQIIDQSEWNRTTRFPLSGPVLAEDWQYLKAAVTGVLFRLLFRYRQQQIVIYPDTNTPGGQTIAFEYVSRWWVQSAAAAAPDKDAPTAKDDLIWFDPLMAVKGLVLEFKKATEQDTTQAQQDFDDAEELCMGDDSPAGVLDLARPTDYGEPLISDINLPITNW
jgi:hypothetical protein